MTPLTWFVVGFFLVAVIQVLVFLEFAAGRRGDIIEGNVMEAMSWIMLLLVMALFYQLHWTIDQLTPAHPLLRGPDDHMSHADLVEGHSLTFHLPISHPITSPYCPTLLPHPIAPSYCPAYCPPLLPHPLPLLHTSTHLQSLTLSLTLTPNPNPNP